MNKLYPKYFLLSVSFFCFVILSGVEESFGQNISINTTGAANTSLSMLEILEISATANSKGLYVLHSGTPIAGTGYGVYSSVTGANTTNISGYLSATGATNNYALIIPASEGIVGIGTTSPISTALVTINPTTNAIRSGIDMTLSGATSAATGLNITTANSNVNGITSTSSASANATYYGAGGLLTSAVVSAANTFAKGYLGYKANAGTNVAANYFAGYFQGKVAVTSNSSPDGVADLEVQNTTTGAGNPATIFLRQTNSLTTTGNVLNNLNFGDNHSASPQAQIQIIRGAAGGAGDLPTDILFYTTPDASATMAERIRIINSGKVGINMYPTMQLDVTNSSTTNGESAIRGAATGATGSVYGMQGTTSSNSNDAVGVFGLASGTGRSHGVLGQLVNSTTANSSGVRGYVLSTTGATFGVWGENASATANATGVYGIATSATGSTNGVWGHVNSTTADAAGVYGSASGNGPVFGVLGLTGTGVITNTASGVVGKANGATGQIYGVTGISMSSTGIGVIGDARETTGANFGVYGMSASTSGTGVYGNATAVTGFTNGVYGITASASNGTGWGSADSKSAGVFGEGGNAGAIGYQAGVYGHLTGTGTNSGGVVGAYSATVFGGLGYKIGAVTYGVYGITGSALGYGVYGTGAASGIGTAGVVTGNGNGMQGSSAGATGTGVLGLATGAGINYGVRGNSSSVTGFDFYAAGAGTDYGTASSMRWKKNIQTIPNALDKLMLMRGCYYDWDEEHGKGKHDIGFIAEEVGKIIPEIVVYEQDSSGYAIGMDYSKVGPLLVEAIKEQQKIIDGLKMEMSDLKLQMILILGTAAENAEKKK